MSNEYTPTTDSVRNAYAERVDGNFSTDADAAFDRWLAAHDAAHDAEVARAAAEKALREAASALDLSAYYPERLSEFHNAEGAAEDWLLGRADRLAGGGSHRCPDCGRGDGGCDREADRG